MQNEEVIIWEAIRRKDRHAFEQYYKQEYQLFFVTACQYVHDPSTALAIVNDVFLSIWEKAGEISIHTTLKGYIHTSVVNRCINHLRKEKRNPRLAHGDIPDSIPSPVIHPLEDLELQIKLLQAIDKLPEQCRKVFRLSRFEKLKQQEIADQLGISIKTVKNHMTLALKRLHQALQEWFAIWIWLAVQLFFQSTGTNHLFYRLLTDLHGLLF